MNLVIPQSYEAVAECMSILSTVDNFCSGQDSRPMISIKQDAMTGSYILTYGRVKIPRETFYDCCFTVDEWSMDYIRDKMIHIRKVHDWVGLTDVEIQKIKTEQASLQEIMAIGREQLRLLKIEYKSDAKNQQQYKDAKRRVIDAKSKIIAEEAYYQTASDNLLFTGHGLFSVLLPDNFEYSCKNNKSPDGLDVKITRGVLISGCLDKTALGRSSGSLSHHIYKDYGAQAASDFVSFLLYFINLWLTRRGFSIGLDDCVPDSMTVFDDALSKGYLEAVSISRLEKDPEMREGKLQNVLNTITTVGEKIARQSLKPTNSMVTMVTSGSKGSVFNLTSITSGVGQQNVEGKRIPKNYGGRTLPHYPRKTDWADCTNLDDSEKMALEFESEGLIISSFTNGLQAEEFFFLNAGGREGLIETAIKTAKTGYVSRRLTKFLEDLKMTHGGMVTNARGNITQFCYGNDAMNPAELIKTKDAGYACCDVAHIMDGLNADYEWEYYQETGTRINAL